jgi:Amt family ammonium transporter
MIVLLCLLFIMLVPLGIAGLALIHQGLGRSRSAAHTMLATLCAMGLAAIVFVVVGEAWAGYAGGATHVLHAGGARWDWLGAERFFADGRRGAGRANALGPLSLCLQVFTVGLVAVIPISTGSDRWRLAGVCVSSVAMAALVYPLFSHWVWGAGWLTQMQANFGLSPFVDAGGAGVVQVVGGLSALSVAWVLGPRKGKYSDGMATAIPGHNIVQVMFGCMLALVGWTGLECAASLLFARAQPEQLIWVVVNAMLAAGSGLLAAVLTTRLRYRKPDSSMSANGWVAGLVAGSAGCCFLSPGQTIFIGLVAGGLVTWLVEWLEMTVLVDDPGGAISVHAGAGIWGLLAYGLLAPTSGDAGTRGVHVLVQLVGVATLLGVMLPLIHGLNVLLNRLVPYRVDRDGDWQGMDIRELGSGAYPEFVMHADEFVPR